MNVRDTTPGTRLGLTPDKILGGLEAAKRAGTTLGEQLQVASTSATSYVPQPTKFKRGLSAAELAPIREFNVPTRLTGKAVAMTPAVTNGKINWKQKLSGFVNDNAGKLVPYMSNIANTVMGPTRPRMGTTISSRKITAPSFDATRNAIEASESAIQRGASQSVDGNTAQAVGLAARAQTLNSLNQLAEQEGNVRAGVGARQASLDMYADQFNAGVVNKYNDDMVDYGNTRTSQTLANLSNASDKFIAAGNVKAMMELDERKAGILGETYSKVRDYVDAELKKKGLFRRGGKLKLYA